MRIGFFCCQRSYSTLGPVITWMGDRLQVGKPSRYVTSHPGQLSLAIPPWVGAVSISECWEGKETGTARDALAPEISAALCDMWLLNESLLTIWMQSQCCKRRKYRDKHRQKTEKNIKRTWTNRIWKPNQRINPTDAGNRDKWKQRISAANPPWTNEINNL